MGEEICEHGNKIEKVSDAAYQIKKCDKCCIEMLENIIETMSISYKKELKLYYTENRKLKCRISELESLIEGK